MSNDGRIDELLDRWEDARERGQPIGVEELCADCPELATEVGRRIAVQETMSRMLDLEDTALSRGPTTIEQLRRNLFEKLPQFEFVAELGSGGMGVVFKARQVKLNRMVALKVLRAGTLARTDELERFRHEAMAVAQLQHPNIVQVYDVGDVDGLPFLCLELVDGGNLAEFARGAQQQPSDAARLIEKIARAVHHAHQRGIVHRDLKPANILLSSVSDHRREMSPGADDAAQFEPKIGDFGLAKYVDRQTGNTLSGAIVGTPAYMAPEQAAGKGRDVGPAADIYALGAVFYELLVGRPPFQGDSPSSIIAQIVNGEPIAVRRLRPEVPRDIETICHRCLQKDPAKRYQSAEALADDLRQFQNGEPIRARRVGIAERTWRWCRRNRMTAALAATAGILLTIILAIFVMQAVEASPQGTRITVQNAGFEHGLDHWKQVTDFDPNDSLTPEQEEVVRIQLQKSGVTTGESYKGKCSLELRCGPYGGGVSQQFDVPVVHGGRITVRAWVKMPNKGKAKNKVLSFTIQGVRDVQVVWTRAVDMGDPKFLGPHSRWTRLQFSAGALAAVDSFRIVLTTGNGKGKGPDDCVYIDDVEVWVSPE